MKDGRFDILVVVVLYGQRLWDCRTGRSLVEGMGGLPLFVYDNSPAAQHTEEEFAGMDARYVHDASNPGLSYAYNRAMDYALERGLNWLLLADQDTWFESGIVSKYVAAVAAHQDVQMFAPRISTGVGRYISPVRRRLFGPRPLESVSLGRLSLDRFCAINSGTFVNVEAMRQVGGYNERVPLDFSDFEFARRFGRLNDVFFVIDAECGQEFSNEVQSMGQKMSRFRVFCTCAAGCEDGVRRNFWVVMRRSLSLCLSSRSFAPLGVMVDKFLFGR